MTTVTRKKLDEALKHIKQDIYDDFWPDIISYRDYIGGDVFTPQSFRSYNVSSLDTMNIPKPNLVLRPGHFMRFTDRVYYHILVNGFAQRVDKKLSSKDIVFSYRISNKNEYFFDRYINGWNCFMEKTDNLFKKNPNGLLLQTDISAYFEHIRIGELIRTLLALGVNKKILDELSRILHIWGHDGIGIPQGNCTSSFLGNVYLHRIDDAMIRAGFIYYRYMDDIRIFAADDSTIREAITKITELCRPLNLHLSGGKTSIINKDKYQSQKHKFADEIKKVNYAVDYNVVDTKDARDNLRNIWKASIKKKDKSLINYCIFRFQKLNLNYPLDTILKLKLLDPSFSPKIFSYLEKYTDRKRVQKVMLDILQNTPYDYQKIFILKTLIRSKRLYLDINLLDKNRLYGSSNFLITGYYMVLMGKFGSMGQRAEMVIDYYHYCNDDDRKARYFLIALKCYGNDAEINQLIRSKPILKKTLLYLRQNNEFF